MTPDKTPSEAREPCPFCGSSRIGVHRHKQRRAVGYKAMCLACGVTQSGVAYPDIEQATSTWNTRAKWGSPVVATKVSIPTNTMEQEFQNHYRRGFEAGKKTSSHVIAGEPRRVFIVATGEDHEGETTYTRYDNAPPPLCDSECLYTTPQPTKAQAGAVQMEYARLHAISIDYSDTEDESIAFRDGWRSAEKHHGIAKEGG